MNAPLKTRGDLAELKVASDLVARGYGVAFPIGEDHDFDLLCWRRGHPPRRVQVKYSTSNGQRVEVRCQSHSLTNGRIRRTKHYTADTIDLLAVYDPTTNRCYYVPASELGAGRCHLTLRLAPAKNNQHSGIRLAEDYLDPDPGPAVEPAGLEPATSSVQGTRSPN
jgi:hypothetical protein